MVSSMESWDRKHGRRGRGVKRFGVPYIWGRVYGLKKYILEQVKGKTIIPKAKEGICSPTLENWGLHGAYEGMHHLLWSVQGE